jgi:uncharacterized flavoprotein (TIGR03862 family)
MSIIRKSVAIIGGGASALMVAAQLDESKFDITIYERNAALGRKLLVAGDGGLNLTHSEGLQQFISRYIPPSFFEPVISSFTNNDLRVWLESVGVETYVGTSKRVFPIKGIKPIDALNAVVEKLKEKNISIKTRHTWKGWKGEQLRFAFDSSHNTELLIKPDITVFALGGASWPVTGSDGSWIRYFSERGIAVYPFQASNCAFEVKWKPEFVEQAEGKALKNLILKCGDKEKKGEIIITKFGLEGGAIYALSNEIRMQLNKNGYAELFIDLKPSFSLQEVQSKLNGRGNKSVSKHLKDELNLSEEQLALLINYTNKNEFKNGKMLAEKIKNLSLIVSSSAAMEEAISTVGGIALHEVGADFQLKKLPGNYVIGEMLDWDAPTGGYLLQGCFSMGYYLAKKLNETAIVF